MDSSKRVEGVSNMSGKSKFGSAQTDKDDDLLSFLSNEINKNEASAKTQGVVTGNLETVEEGSNVTGVGGSDSSQTFDHDADSSLNKSEQSGGTGKSVLSGTTGGQSGISGGSQSQSGINADEQSQVGSTLNQSLPTVDDKSASLVNIEGSTHKSGVVSPTQESGIVTSLSEKTDKVTTLDEESIDHQSGEFLDKSQEDKDFVEDSLDTLSSKEKDLANKLDQLSQMSQVGEIDKSVQEGQKSTVSKISGISPTEDQTVDHSTPLSKSSISGGLSDEGMKDVQTGSVRDVDTESQESFIGSHKSTIEHEQFSEKDVDAETQESFIGSHKSTIEPDQIEIDSSPKKTIISETSRSPISEDKEDLYFKKKEQERPIEKDVETVITDENDRPLTEQDKEIILDELQGKPAKTDVHINHQSIESLHHINVYHYLPPKFIAGTAPYMYPGMMPPPQQQMTPGPIINIHNSTSSSGGGQGGNNAYDVGPDGKLHSMGSSNGGGSGQVVVANPPTPSQNWGQVVYSNTHHAVHGGTVSTVSQPQVTQPNVVNQPIVEQSSMMNNPMMAAQNQMNADSMNQIQSSVISSNLDQEPNVVQIPNQSPNIINDKPIISADEIKVDPIINSEVINKSPINIGEDSHSIDSHSTSSHSATSHSSETSSNHSSDHHEDSIKSSDLDTHGITQLDENNDEMFAPSEYSNEDIETVDVDPKTVNDGKGQDVILGDDTSEDFENKSMVII